jgi:hypothetical protein
MTAERKAEQRCAHLFTCRFSNGRLHARSCPLYVPLPTESEPERECVCEDHAADGEHCGCERCWRVCENGVRDLSPAPSETPSPANESDDYLRGWSDGWAARRDLPTACESPLHVWQIDVPAEGDEKCFCGEEVLRLPSARVRSETPSPEVGMREEAHRLLDELIAMGPEPPVPDHVCTLGITDCDGECAAFAYYNNAKWALMESILAAAKEQSK